MPQAPDANRTPAAVSTATLILLCICFVLSGMAALIYQTAWTRQFAILFGTSELAIATVLAAYMGGLALGAWLVERFLPRLTRPVLTYALLEVGIAASAIVVVPALLWMSNQALQAFFGNQPAPPDSELTATALFYLVSAFIALAIPTTLMGATLPLLARFAVSEEAQIGRRIGLLYAMNTAGAVLGALLTAFALLPELGLSRTIWAGAVLNGVVFLLAVIITNRSSAPPPPKGYSLGEEPEVPGAYSTLSKPKAPAVAAPRPRVAVFGRLPATGWVLPVMLLAGAVAFFQEVLWSRMLAHVVGSSIYAFGVMVASFLTGIAVGGGIGAAIARTREAAAMALAVALIVAAAAAATAYLLLDNLLPERGGLLQNSRMVLGFIQVPMNALFSGLLLLPMTIAIGVTYPLAVRVLARDADDAAPASARVYAWNTVGAILGSLAAGFWIIPELRYEGAIRVAVLASATLGIVAAWVLVQPRRVFAIAASVLAIAGCVLFQPQPPWQLLVTSPLNVGDTARVLYYDVGRSASVVVLAQDGNLAIRTNGLPEALMEGPGSLQRYSGEFWLAPLAVVARPEARDMLIVGFGGGVVVEAVPPSVQHIDVIELEPKVIAANKATANLRKRDPLNDPRVNVIVNDARGALRLTSRRYDAIVSQPSHPWTAGASHLYTKEFMELAHGHLNPGGVFVQWMNVNFMDEGLMRSLVATLLSVFPEVRVYRPDPTTVIFLASDLKLDPELRLATTGQPLRQSPLHYARYGMNTVEDLVTALVLETDGARQMATGAPLITDDDNRIATSNVFERGSGMTGDASGRMLAAYDPLQRPKSVVYDRLAGSMSFPYLARRNALFAELDFSFRDRMTRMFQILGPGADGEYARAYLLRIVGQGSRSLELLRLAIDDYPRDDALRAEYLSSWFGPLSVDRAPAEVVEVTRGLAPLPALVLTAARHAAKQEWQQLSQLDGELARVPWTHAWYADAVVLRSRWRVEVSNAEARKAMADEVLVLLDRLCVINPTMDMLLLRTRAGIQGERPEIIVESIAMYARTAQNLVRRGARNADSLRAEINDLSKILDAVGSQLKFDPVRLAEVRAELGRVLSN